jgi:NAD(P)-dependent dehydrogenase (short-subunit alcohol dehydrogenase family)
MDLGLKGKVAVITGATDGIGRASAMLFAMEGAKVAICARKIEGVNATVEAIRKAGGDAFGMAADMSSAADAEKFIEGVAKHFGRLDILVNNAGTSMRGGFLELTDEQYKSDLELKVFGAMRCARAAIPHMRKQGGGRIVNITTVGAKQPGAGSMPTTMSRAAGMVFTKSLSKEFAKDNILVNTVSVGLLKSGQHNRRAAASGADQEEMYKKMGKDVPIGRVGEAEEAANVIVFLASGAASYVTGTSVNVDGGTSGVL